MLAIVRRVRSRQVDVGIVVVYDGGEEIDNGSAGQEYAGYGEGNVCTDEWAAVIRKEDVRATEKDKVVCAEGFRVGDVVRGVVVGPLLLSFVTRQGLGCGIRGVGRGCRIGS